MTYAARSVVGRMTPNHQTGVRFFGGVPAIQIPEGILDRSAASSSCACSPIGRRRRLEVAVGRVPLPSSSLGGHTRRSCAETVRRTSRALAARLAGGAALRRRWGPSPFPVRVWAGARGALTTATAASSIGEDGWFSASKGRFDSVSRCHSRLAQPVERETEDLRVGGSNPSPGTIAPSSNGRTLASGTRDGGSNPPGAANHAGAIEYRLVRRPFKAERPVRHRLAPPPTCRRERWAGRLCDGLQSR